MESKLLSYDLMSGDKLVPDVCQKRLIWETILERTVNIMIQHHLWWNNTFVVIWSTILTLDPGTLVWLSWWWVTSTSSRCWLPSLRWWWLPSMRWCTSTSPTGWWRWTMMLSSGAGGMILIWTLICIYTMSRQIWLLVGLTTTSWSNIIQNIYHKCIWTSSVEENFQNYQHMVMWSLQCITISADWFSSFSSIHKSQINRPPNHLLLKPPNQLLTRHHNWWWPEQWH